MFKKMLKAFCVICLVLLGGAAYGQENETWPFIGFIEEGTKWELEVSNVDFQETVSVSQTLKDTEVINGKTYIKLWSSIEGGEANLVSYIYIDVINQSVYALDPNAIDRGERMIYTFMPAVPESTKIACISWDGKISETDYFIRKSGTESYVRYEGYSYSKRTIELYSDEDMNEGSLLGKVEWIRGIGNPTGFLNQCYSLDPDVNVILKRVIADETLIVYDSATLSVNTIDSDVEKTIDKIYDINGRNIPELVKGINIIHYSDGSVDKVLK